MSDGKRNGQEPPHSSLVDDFVKLAEAVRGGDRQLSDTMQAVLDARLERYRLETQQLRGTVLGDQDVEMSTEEAVPPTADHNTSEQSNSSLNDWSENASVALEGAVRDPNLARDLSSFQPASNGVMTYKSDAEGNIAIGPTRDLVFTVRTGEYPEIEALVDALIADAKSRGLRWNADRIPGHWDDQLQQAVALKRAGEFLASVRIFDRLIRTAGVAYSGALSMMYKPVACSGALRAGVRLLVLGRQILESGGAQAAKIIAFHDDVTLFDDYRSALFRAVQSSESLEQYLRQISGNVNYTMPRAYAGAALDLRDL